VLINLETIVGGYIRGQALTSAFMAVFTFGLLLACGVPNPLALAAFAGVADVLPYIGAALAIGPSAAATAASQDLVRVLIVVGVMLAYQEFESRVIVPRVYGRVLRLPSSMVLLALLVGGVLMGVIGALLALPVAAALRMLFQEARTILPGERFDDSTIRERDARAEREYSDRTENMPSQEAAAVAIEITHARLEEEGGREAALDVPMTAAH
jgi:predicted PurR-regulated permease PerM